MQKLADKLFPIIKDDDVAIIDIPPEQRRLHTETYDFSISTLVEYLRNGAVLFQSSNVNTYGTGGKPQD